MAIQDTLEALNDPIRRAILEILRAQITSAGDLARQTGLTPSRLSYHLGKLKAAGLVSSSRQGKTVLYEPNLTVLDETIVWMRALQGSNTKTETAAGVKHMSHTSPARTSQSLSPQQHGSLRRPAIA